MYICIYIYVCMYVYIYAGRGLRAGGDEFTLGRSSACAGTNKTHMRTFQAFGLTRYIYMCVCVCVYIYIMYIYIYEHKDI